MILASYGSVGFYYTRVGFFYTLMDFGFGIADLGFSVSEQETRVAGCELRAAGCGLPGGRANDRETGLLQLKIGFHPYFLIHNPQSQIRNHKLLCERHNLIMANTNLQTT
jgi:hypothetical protein